MNYLEIDLRNENDEIITLDFEIYNNSLSEFWMDLLERNLIDKKVFKKHACFLGWTNNKNRQWQELITDINNNLKQLNISFPDMCKGIQLPTDINLIKSTDFNYTHQIFAELLGHNDKVNDYFGKASPEVRWQIVKLNHLSHELQAYYDNSKLKPIPKPFLNVHFYHGHQAKITPDLNEFFTIGNHWGEIYVGSIDIGKNYFDAFNDKDEDVDPDHLKNLSIATGEFNVHFSEYRFYPKAMAELHQWLASKNVDINDPNLRLGTGKVGCFKQIRNYNLLDRAKTLDIISNYADVYRISLIRNNHRISNNYNYRMQDVDVEIKQF